MDTVKTINELFENRNWGAITIFILVVSLPPIYKRLVNADFSKLTRFSKLKEFHKLNTEGAVFLNYINEEIENLAFYKVTGIRTNKERRRQILETFNKLNTDGNEFSMMHFKRAYAWLKFENGILSVHIELFSKLFFSAVFTIGLFFFAFLLVLDIIWLFNLDEFKDILGNMIQINIMCITYGTVMVASSYPLNSIKKLQKKLKEQGQNIGS